MKKLTRPELAHWLTKFMRREMVSAADRGRLEQIHDILQDTLSKADRHVVALLRANIKIRGDAGPTGELGPEEEFVRINSDIWPVERLMMGPSLLESQLNILEERLL